MNLLQTARQFLLTQPPSANFMSGSVTATVHIQRGEDVVSRAAVKVEGISKQVHVGQIVADDIPKHSNLDYAL
jgi:hypothetical protein